MELVNAKNRPCGLRTRRPTYSLPSEQGQVRRCYSSNINCSNTCTICNTQNMQLTLVLFIEGLRPRLTSLFFIIGGFAPPFTRVLTLVLFIEGIAPPVDFSFVFEGFAPPRVRDVHKTCRTLLQAINSTPQLRCNFHNGFPLSPKLRIISQKSAYGIFFQNSKCSENTRIMS